MLDSPDSVLVMLSPDDSVDAAIAKVRQADAPQITLLVPDGTRALQSMGACDKLRQGAQQAGKTVTIYSSDEKTCNAAQLCKLSVVRIDASMPTGGPPTPRGATPAGPKPARQQGRGSPAAFDDDFLASLDRVPGAPANPVPQPRGFQDLERSERSPTAFTDPLDDEWAAALNDFSRATIGEQQPRGAPSEAEWASAFDDLSDTFAADAGLGGVSETPRQRFRAEDMELTDEDLRRQLPHKERRKRDRKPSRIAGIFGAIAGLRRHPVAHEDDDLELEPATMPLMPRPERSEQELVERDRQRRKLTLIPIATLALLGLLAGLFWMIGRGGTKATVQISPPEQQSGQQIANIILSPDDINGIPLQATVSVSRTGQVAGESVAPISQARGVIVVANRLFEPITLEKGKAVAVGTNPAGQPVRFLIDETVTVPASEETFAGLTFGTATLPVVAISGGPSHNIPGETQLTIEGHEGALRAVSQGSIEGGEEQVQKVVTPQDAEALLGQMLPLLARQANDQLSEQAARQGAGLPDPSVIPVTPTLDVLKSTPDSYRIETIPPLGSVTESGEFTLVVSADFSVIAFPSGVDYRKLLNNEVITQLKQTAQADPDKVDIKVQGVVLRGEQLVASALATPKGGVLPESFLKELAGALGNMSKQEATSHLEELKKKGSIGSYQLPADDPLPPAEDLQVQELRP